ncbi:hypothetical protein EDD15DRAFT_1351697 [Pisolithus albus]|nr:hypothetical protein EDD15DRAFT_1351697 [Pisolithus albus]
MSVSETLQRILARFPKLLIAIVKRCSSTTLRLLQYMFSFRNASVLQSRERKHLSNIENSSPSTSPSNDEEKGRETGAAAGVSGAATILCSSDRGRGPPSQADPTTDASRRPVGGEGLRGYKPRTFSCDPPLRKPMPLLDKLTGLFTMLTTLDHPGFIGRSLKATQDKGKRNHHRETNVERWVIFCDTFQKDVENVNLLVSLEERRYLAFSHWAFGPCGKGYCTPDGKLQLLGYPIYRYSGVVIPAPKVELHVASVCNG